jgi:putative dehydrogenase
MRMHHGQHVPNVTVDIFLKDLGIVMNTASAMNCAVPVGQAAFRLYKEASEHGHGSESGTLLASFLRQKEYNS